MDKYVRKYRHETLEILRLVYQSMAQYKAEADLPVGFPYMFNSCFNFIQVYLYMSQ